MKNKTTAVWITLLTGPLGLSRMYVKGKIDVIGWALIVPTLLGLYGVLRARSIGLDDPISWILIPLLGLSIAACALTAIVYGLMDTSKWNSLYNPSEASESPLGRTGWLTIFGVALSLFAGAIILLSTIAFGFERYFEFQADQPAAKATVSAIRKFAG
ncbi:MAG: hypothetical protein RLZ68_1367 [Pseudomonadota bacterium]